MSALADGDDVWHVAEALAAEVVAEAPPGADHLVGDQQHVVAVADLAHPLEVAVGRDKAAAGVLDRLKDHRGDGLGPLELTIRSSIALAAQSGSRSSGQR